MGKNNWLTKEVLSFILRRVEKHTKESGYRFSEHKNSSNTSGGTL